ncbi:lipase family protein [Nocardia huaxiensis]|uniref:lipase family protein n=1 Tax=Nocardia huaxiensis TaxID=2755382 RepID=UPI001E4AE840|nr:lipase family protein [Nocardia huaxiensis]UFS98940.1 lipase family protein [Nocardia huaxiensis]
MLLLCSRILLAALLIGCTAALNGAAGIAHAQPDDAAHSDDPAQPGDVSGTIPANLPGLDLPGLQRWIEELVPPPNLPPAPDTPLVDGADLPPELASLRAAVMPSAIGDGFVDDWPEDLADFAPGQLITWRDITQTASGVLFVPVRQVVQLKYRTTDSHGLPSYAVSTLVVPTGVWAGEGQRPVVVNNLPINSLGRDCNPGHTLAHGFSRKTNLADYIPPTTQLALLRGYAVLIPDHEGPRMAYAEPFVAGHAVLDGIRSVRESVPDEFGASRFGLIGYSGGAIATNGAVRLMSDYAPELIDVVAGAAMGGVPADYEILARSMNANLASGVFMAATFAIGRERPEILERMNSLAQWAAVSVMKDTCMDTFALFGLLLLPIDIAANILDPLQSDLARDIYSATRMEGRKSPVPLYIYHGEQEFWVPPEGAKNLYVEQCALGANAVYRSVLGEHIIAAFTGYPEALIWLDARLRGEAAISEC